MELNVEETVLLISERCCLLLFKARWYCDGAAFST